MTMISRCFTTPVAAFLRTILLALWAFAWVILTANSTSAAPDLSSLCDQAAMNAAQATGVPLSVLKAISLNETGRKRNGAFRPWPWTVNMEGKGVWFDTPAEAQAYVDENFARGARSFDVGCFQINYKWHGQNFASIEEMFEPTANGLYAAKFLSDLYAETGSWTKAAGAYHSRTPTYAEKYSARFEKFRQKFVHEDGGATTSIPEIPDIVLAAYGGASGAPSPGLGETRVAEVRVNTYPLLQVGGTAGLGSLVPIGNGGAASLFAPLATPLAEVN